MGKLHTHYDNLKVSREAPLSVIKASYKVLAQEHHPDRCKTPDAPRRMQIINDAYAELSDPIKRAAHDRWIRDNEPRPEVRPAPAPEPVKNVLTEDDIERAKQNLRTMHRLDIIQIRQEHADELKKYQKYMAFDKKVGIVIGLVISIPFYMLFSAVDKFITLAQAEPVYQQAQVGGSHVTNLDRTHGEALWREHTAERTTKQPRTHPGM